MKHEFALEIDLRLIAAVVELHVAFSTHSTHVVADSPSEE